MSFTSNNSQSFAEIPLRFIGPVKIIGQVLNEEIKVPLATFESPLWPSTNRGALVSRLTEGIRVTLTQDCMTRSVLLEAPNAEVAANASTALLSYRAELEKVVSDTSRFARLEDWHVQIVGKLLFIRFSMKTGDAAGHNMTTFAADALLSWIIERFPKLQYVSISGNFCCDKKVSSVNGILGRGKYAIAEIEIPRSICQTYLKTTPEKIVELNIKKNLIGSIIAGGVRTANAHFANMLLAFYLATGQDAANIIEGSQGIVQADLVQPDLVQADLKQKESTAENGPGLYFSVTLPNLIVGSVGNGKQLEFVKNNLAQLGCLTGNTTAGNTTAENQTDATAKNQLGTKSQVAAKKQVETKNQPGDKARRLAAIAAATVLCGELSLLAAQTNPGELMKSHLRLERLQPLESQHSKSQPVMLQVSESC